MSTDSYNYSLKLLAKRDYSKFKLRQKLASRFSDEEIEEAIELLLEKNFLREEEYARIRIKSLLISGNSNSLIKLKLENEELKVSDDLINQVKEDNGLGEASSIEELIRKKMRHKEVPVCDNELLKLKHKLLNFLASKGHNLEESQEQIDKWLRTGECI
ncbi:MAG: hypothetical protein CME64_15520 [Halobacteriovoraceae bacterium]|nr:hypothetical protein [Halobacteriovoraceae bacterium]|tara:strand:- start:156128 stop:156604 length:477 start_codon:yes stop_codon:yes gene_type:complete